MLFRSQKPLLCWKNHIHQKKLYLLTHRNERGFTLLETVVALSVTMLCAWVLSFSYRHFRVAKEATSTGKEMEFHLFVHQFEQDIKGMEYVHHLKQELKLQRWVEENQSIEEVYYERYGQLLRRRVSKQGHQPMLTGIEAVKFDVHSSFLWIDVFFMNGEKHHAEIPLSSRQ